MVAFHVLLILQVLYLLKSSRLEVTAPQSSIITTCEELSRVVRVKRHAVDRARVWLVKVHTIITFCGVLEQKVYRLREHDKRSPKRN